MKMNEYSNHSNTRLQIPKPIIVNISNPSTSVVSNFDVFNTQYLTDGFGGGTWSAAGNFTLHDVTISSPDTISFLEILGSFQSNPFTVGAVYLKSLNDSRQQITDIYSITSESLEGKLYTKKVKPFKNINENVSTYNHIIFNVGSLTKLTWKKIYPLVVFQICLFPEQIINPILALTGQIAEVHYSRPIAIGNLRGW